MINVHLYPSPFTNESRIFRETRSLMRFGLFTEIHLVGTFQSGLPRTEVLAPGHQIRRLGEDRRRSAGLIAKIARTLAWSFRVMQEYRHEPVSCINCHSISVLPVGVLLKRTTGAKLVYDAHELETETNGLTGVRQKLTRWMERRLIGSVDCSIFVGREIDRWYRGAYGLSRTAVIYNCPNLTPIEPSDYFRDQFGIPADRPIFLYQGVIAPGRGLELLVEAFEQLTGEAVLVVMGYGPRQEWVQQRLERLDNGYYHPAVPPDRLLHYTGAADFGVSLIEPVSLSYELCMPNKLFEYLMAGKPVLVSPTSEQRDFVIEQDVGVVARDLSVEAIVEAVRTLIRKNPVELNRAVDRARSAYNWEAQECELRKIYASIGFSTSADEAA